MITDVKINEAEKRRFYENGAWGTDTIADVWQDRSTRFADRVYVQDDLGCSLTYREVDEGASRIAAWLTEKGVRNGDVVSFQVPKWAEFCMVYVACVKIGAVMHPVATAMNAADLEYIFNQVGTKAYICPTFSYKTDYELEFQKFRDRTPSLRALLLLDKVQPAHDENAATLSKVLESVAPFTGPCPAHSGRMSPASCRHRARPENRKPRCSRITTCSIRSGCSPTTLN